MLCLGAHTQLQHIAQDSHTAARPVAQHRQRCCHGLRACVIAVLDDGVTLLFKDLLPSGHIPELLQTLANIFCGNTQFRAHSHSCQSVVDKMLSFQGKFHGERTLFAAHPEVQMAVALFHILSKQLALAVGNTKVYSPVSQALLPAPQQGIITV